MKQWRMALHLVYRTSPDLTILQYEINNNNNNNITDNNNNNTINSNNNNNTNSNSNNINNSLFICSFSTTKWSVSSATFKIQRLW